MLTLERCQNDVAIPKDAPSGKPYTLYWVWDWSTLPNVDPGLPKGKAELYTTCMDIDVTSSGSGAKSNVAVKYAEGQSLNEAAIPAYISQLAAGENTIASPSQSPAASAPAASAPVTSQRAAAQQPQSVSSPQAPTPNTVTQTVYVTVSNGPTAQSIPSK